jgi:uncharacterized low-complexity protein
MENSMSQKTNLKPLAIAVGAALATSLAATTPANAAENPFAMSELSSGYMVAEMAEGKCGGEKKAAEEGKCGEGKCGAAMMGTSKTSDPKEGKCGAGKCDMKMMDADGDGAVSKEEFMQAHDGMFGKMDTNGDGVIDADEHSAGMKMMKEGKCGGAMATDKAKMMKEGKCGEGKCGANK